MLEAIQHSELHSKHKEVPGQAKVHNNAWLLEETLA
jgi:hypothetical protein